ncbi:hypothetical protein [Xylophilus sp. GOD-11R]|uniref:hypothetical protein n=1 Tax=Xylophilus sp. GOD-11R TaxID=3089814 RepID=UPI00298CBF9F|nr:hypothetical protein [Xylophilus sp. GOD-11R]WPB57190.1 hypothetical protein R9X41_00575 [Xylophilus sp. GOD-11R]
MMTIRSEPFSSSSPRRAALAGLCATAALLSGCATGPFANNFAGTAYSCDNGVAIRVKEDDGSAMLQTGRGAEALLRDAGGVGPEQVVYSNPQVRFETGLPPDTRGASLEGAVPNGRARCWRGRTISDWFR